jgi:hypothetical protein
MVGTRGATGEHLAEGAGGVDRYLFAAPVLVAGLTIALAGWNDL